MKEKLTKARQLLVKAEEELAKYKANKNFAYASQAAEKCWVIINFIIESKLNIELRTGSIKVIKPYANELGLGQLATDCYTLHVYHYEGEKFVVYDEDLIYLIESCLEQEKELLR